ncbi:ribosomal protein S19 binding protein 1 isoform X2 [Rhincodon typus]|uniref:ribosomal protein S19 binding protein 1 isoform X2 n=1 Tax=Rhincodon typus TaxID=259920 RepID=UPI0009A2C399|nr:ribosomal protein S19 binding protein 1 isoform X2 [Rhincodon typus]
MSAALVRKGLELMSQDLRDKGRSRKAIPRHTSSADRLHLVNTNKKGTKKQLKSLQGQGKNKSKATVKGKVVKSALEEYWKKKAADHTEENLQYMLGARFLTESKVTKKVLNYSQGRKAKDRPEEKEVKKEEKSIFTESDFRKFEREYFGAP